MKKSLCILMLLCGVFIMADSLPSVFIERFDADEIMPGAVISGGASVVADAGLEKGALVCTGNGEPNQIAYLYAFDVQPGEKYAWAMHLHTEGNVVSNTIITQAVFLDKAGKQAAPTTYFKHYACADRFMHRTGVFQIPENCAKVQLMLRLAGVAPDCKAFFDNLRIAKCDENGWAKGISFDSFDCAFDGWCLDRYLLFERFSIATGGHIVNEWKEAKVGEAFFEVRGTEAPMQYSLWIENINVKPGFDYRFDAWYKATDDFIYTGHGILIFFYKDDEGRDLGQSRFHIKNTKDEWKQLVHGFQTPEGCTRLTIGLNTRNMKPEEFVRLDHVRLAQVEGKCQLDVSIDPDTASMQYMGGLSGGLKAASGKLQMLDDAGKPVLEQNAIPGEPGTVDLKNVTDGHYVVRLEIVLDNGDKIAAEDVKVVVCKQPYWSNDLGMPDAQKPAPLPWKNLSLKDGVVQTWNDRIAFDEKFLQLLGCSDILSAPMELLINGASYQPAGKVTWIPGTSLVTGILPIKGSGYSGKLEISVDYTGFTRFAIKLNNQSRIESLNMAFRLSALDFIHRSDDSWTDVGAVNLVAQPVWKTSHFFNEIGFGSEASGLAWYAPNIYPAKADAPAEWLVADRNARSVSMSLIHEPVEVSDEQPFEMSFAIAPYPFRPASDSWKSVRFRAGDKSNLDLIWQTSSLFKYYGSLPDSANPEKMHSMLDERRTKLLFYQFPFYIMDNIPEWSYFQKHWKAQPSRAYDFKPDGMGVKGDIRCRTWQDLYLSRLDEHLKEYKWDGIYFDCFGTDVFTEQGRLFHPTFDTRLFQERIFRVQHDLLPDSITLTHMGAAQFGTAAAFSDIILMGEQYRAQFLEHDYFTQFLTLDEFRQENTVNVGPTRMLLPQYRRKEQIESPEKCSHVMGMALLHNLLIYPNFIDKNTELSIRYRLYDVNPEVCVFNPYWIEGAAKAKLDDPSVKLSEYRGDDKAFAIVFNPTPDARKVHYTPGSNDAKCIVFNAADASETEYVQENELELPPHGALFVIENSKP